MQTRSVVLLLIASLAGCGAPSTLAEVPGGTWRVIHNARADVLHMFLVGEGSCPVLDESSLGAELNGARMRLSSAGSASMSSYYLIPYEHCEPIQFSFDAPSQVVKTGEPVALTVHDASQSIYLRNEMMTKLEVVLLPAATRRGGDPLEFELRTPLENLDTFGWGDLFMGREQGPTPTWTYPTKTRTRYSTTVPTAGPGTYTWRLPIEAAVKNTWCLSQLECAPVVVQEAIFSGTFVVDP